MCINVAQKNAKRNIKAINEAKSQKQKFVVFAKWSLNHIHLWINFVVPIVELKIKSQKDADDGLRSQPKKELGKTTQDIEMGCILGHRIKRRKGIDYF